MIQRIWIVSAVLVALTTGTESSPKHEIPTWNYDNQTAWGDTYLSCTHGVRQSPIFLHTLPRDADHHGHHAPGQVYLSAGCRFHAGKTTVEKESNYRTVEVYLHHNDTASKSRSKPEPAGCKLLFDNKYYDFVRLHFHVGPEHPTGNAADVGEVHFVFSNESNTVVAALHIRETSITTGRAAKFFQQTIGMSLPEAGVTTSGTLEEDIGLDDAFPVSDGSYATYPGSLTTPPCKENVQFIVFQASQHIPQAIFRTLVKALRAYMPTTFDTYHNNRIPREDPKREVLWFQDQTTTSTNRWVLDPEAPAAKPSKSLNDPFTAYWNSSSSNNGIGGFFFRHAFAFVMVLIGLAGIGAYVKMRDVDPSSQVGVSDAAREAATYGTMET